MKIIKFFKRLNPFPNTYTGYHKSKFGIGKTAEGWTRHHKRMRKVYRVHYYFEKVMDFLTQYPFNKYGWTDFKYWFKYRLQKKHQYHKLDLGLKPGYYDLDTIYEKAIANPRFFKIFNDIYENWYGQRNNTSEDGSPIYTRDFGNDMKELKKAVEWMCKGKPRVESKVEKLYDSLPKKPKGVSALEWLARTDGRSSKIYRRINEIENKSYKKTTWALMVIVKNRGCLWT